MAGSNEGRGDFAQEDIFFDKTTAPTATRDPNSRPTGGHDVPNTGKRVYNRKSGIHGKGLRHVGEASKKHGEGHGNWGDTTSGEEALEAEVGPLPTLPGEEEFGGESNEETKRAMEDAYRPDKEDEKVITLDEFEKKQGTSV